MDRFFLKYINSHIYDIYAILVGTLTLAMVMILKIPIKKYSRQAADRKYEIQTEKWMQTYKRRNGWIFALVLIVAIPMFAVAAQISPQIEFSMGSAVMSAVYAIAEYELMDQIL